MPTISRIPQICKHKGLHARKSQNRASWPSSSNLPGPQGPSHSATLAADQSSSVLIQSKRERGRAECRTAPNAAIPHDAEPGKAKTVHDAQASKARTLRCGQLSSRHYSGMRPSLPTTASPRTARNGKPNSLGLTSQFFTQYRHGHIESLNPRRYAPQKESRSYGNGSRNPRPRIVTLAAGRMKIGPAAISGIRSP
jgi:hypothetical protein